MNPFALIARCDHGGITAQSWEVWRQLQPLRTLVVDLGNGGHTIQGRSNPGMYLAGDQGGQVRVTADGFPTEEETSWLVADPAIRSVFTVEVLYGDAQRWTLAMWGGRVVVQANPELFSYDVFGGCDLIIAAPTAWERDKLAGAPVVDLPVPVVLHPPRPVRDVDRPRFYHPHGAAMLDRNGTKYVAGAVGRIERPIEAVLSQRAPARTRRAGCQYLPPPDTATYEDVWTVTDPDVVVIPRRYGGLCLPMQEAAARGIPIIATDLPPQNAWLPVSALVTTKHERDFPMKGGLFGIYSVQIADVQAAIERFCDPQVRKEHAELVYEHAETLAWDRWSARYLELLCP